MCKFTCNYIVSSPGAITFNHHYYNYSHCYHHLYLSTPVLAPLESSNEAALLPSLLTNQTTSHNQSPLLKQNEIVLNKNNILNNIKYNASDENNENITLILMNEKRIFQILETIHGTKYTATTNQSITSNQRFTTKPKESKLLKILDESWESTKTLSDTYRFFNESWEPTEKSSDTYRYTEKPTVSISPRPHISYTLTQRVSTATQPNGNDKYTRRIYVPVTTPKLKSIHIDNNFHSQHLSSVLKITNKNNHNNINFQQNVLTVSKNTKNNNNNCHKSNNNNIILQLTRNDFITYLQLEPESQQLPSNSYWMYNVIQFVKLLCLLKLLFQNNTSRNNIVMYSYSDILSTFTNTIQNQSSFNIKRDHHISHIKPESTAFFSSPLTVLNSIENLDSASVGKC